MSKDVLYVKHQEHFQDIDEESEDENDESDSDEEANFDTLKTSEIKPVLALVEVAMEKESKLLQNTKLKCENCDL